MKLRWLKIPLILLLLILGAVPIGGWWLINHEAASRWLLQQVFNTLNGQISVETINRPLREGIELHRIKFYSDSQNVQVKEVVLLWQLEDLFSGLLKIKQLKLDGVTVVLLKSEEEKSDFDPLAKIDLPLNLAVDDFSLTNLRIKQDQNRYHIDKIQFSAATADNKLYLPSLKLQGEGANVAIKGQTQLGEGFAFKVGIDWQFSHPEQGKWRGALSAKGNSSTVSFDNQLLSPFILQQQGKVENVLKNPTLATRGTWQNLRYPLTGKLIQIASETGDFNATGSAETYQIQLNAKLKQEKIPPAQLHFQGQGTQKDIHIKQLQLLTPSGNLQIQGDVGWDKNTKFDLTASATHFNPAIAAPEMPGDLNLNSHLQGQLIADKLQLGIDIAYLKGTLRNYPLFAEGQLLLNDKDLTVKNIHLASGQNKVSAKGKLGEKNAVLDILIAAPQLQALWKDLGGQLNATAHLQGELTHPSIQLKATGKQLRFAEHGVKEFSITTDYAADGKKSSHLQLNATDLNSGKNSITKLQLSAQGVLTQHSFQTQIHAPEGDLGLALTGAWRDNRWQSRLSELILFQPLAGRWQLKQPTQLFINKHPKGVDVALNESCFGQAAAFVCLEGSYPANGNFQGALRALLPTELGKKYFPSGLQFNSQIHLQAQAHKDGADMHGQYQVRLTKNSPLALTVDKQVIKMLLNTVALTGTLQGTRLNNQLEFVYGDKNYLRGQLALDTANQQTMQGQFSAALLDFSPLTPFIVPLSELKGNLTAAVNLAGTVTKPEITGNVALNKTSVKVETAGLHLQDMNLKLQSQAANPHQIIITGAAKSGAGQLNLNGKTQIEPNSGYPTHIKISGANFEVVQLPQATIAIAPNLNFQYGKDGGTLVGKISLDKAKIELAELPANAVIPSEDEVIVGQEVAKVEEKAPAPPFAVDIALDLGKAASFSGVGMKTQLVGKVQLSKKAEQLAMFGDVTLEKGRYKSYGQDLTMRRGKFVFNGSPSNPLLDVEATRLSKSKKITAVLKVTGTLQNPKTQILSEPEVPEADALAYLITGNSINRLTKSEGNMLANAALSYGAGQMSWLTEKFGIDEMELEQGETLKDSLLAIGQYLTPEFYVGAKVGLFNKQTSIVTKYKISDSFNIGTQSGDSQRVNVNYEFSFE